jgi:hypothetical protein
MGNTKYTLSQKMNKLYCTDTLENIPFSYSKFKLVLKDKTARCRFGASMTYAAGLSRGLHSFSLHIILFTL